MKCKLLLIIGFIYILILSVFVSANLVELEPQLEHQKSVGRFVIASFFFILLISGCIILSSWILHLKDKDSSKYVFHGSLGFLIASFSSFFVSLVLSFLSFWIQELLFITVLILEFMFYKKTKKLFWLYALVFSIVLMLYVILVYTYLYSYYFSIFREV